MPHPNPRLLIPVAVITVLAVGGYYVERTRSRQRSALSGFFESQPAELSSRIGGRVTRIEVDEGDSVRKGETVMILEADPSVAESQASEAAVRQAESRLAELQAGARSQEIRRQEEVVEETRAALSRVKNGFRPEEIAAAQARLRQAEAAHRKVVSGPRPQEIEQARAAEQAARARLAQAARGATAEERNQARARVTQVDSELELARKDLQRYRILFDEGAVSRQRLDQAQTQVESLQARRSEAQQAMQRLERGTPSEEMQEARAAHRQAEAALKLALAGSRREDIQAAAAEVSAARANLQLLESGSRPEDIRAAQSRMDQALAALDLFKAGARKEQLDQAQAAVDAARAQSRAQSERTGERVIRAAQDGAIERILVAIGDLVTPGMPVARVADPSDIWIRVYVPESNLAKVTVGATADLKVDGIESAIAGVVESVSPRGEFTPGNLQTPKDRGKQVFAVRLRLKTPDSRVKPGMYATVSRIGEWQP